jgi:uncharacterized protein DUF5675
VPLLLQRVLETTQGTIGQFTLSDDTTLFSMERMSTGAHPRIPAGLYEITLDTYHKGGYPAYLVHVAGRDRILIHAANRAAELEGCIAPGRTLGYLNGELAVLSSLLALKKIMEVLHGVERDYLTIRDPN